MDLTRRELTDKIQLLGKDKINWGMVGRLLAVFKLQHVNRCCDLMPEKIWENFTPTNKIKYLWAICRSEASKDDYIRKDKDRCFNLEDFKL